jgi:hypothetical protein
VLLDGSGTQTGIYRVVAKPSAVLVQADGKLASGVTAGMDGIRLLMGAALRRMRMIDHAAQPAAVPLTARPSSVLGPSDTRTGRSMGRG